jgi:hypothetical protein
MINERTALVQRQLTGENKVPRETPAKCHFSLPQIPHGTLGLNPATAMTNWQLNMIVAAWHFAM